MQPHTALRQNYNLMTAAPLINDKEAADEADIIARRILPAEDIIHDKEKSLGADDFADFLAVTKGVYTFIGTHNPDNPDTGAAHHNGHFDIDEKAMLISCNLYVDYAIAYLNGEFNK